MASWCQPAVSYIMPYVLCISIWLGLALFRIEIQRGRKVGRGGRGGEAFHEFSLVRRFSEFSVSGNMDLDWTHFHFPFSSPSLPSCLFLISQALASVPAIFYVSSLFLRRREKGIDPWRSIKISSNIGKRVPTSGKIA